MIFDVLFGTVAVYFMIFFLLVFAACFFTFVYKVIGGVNIGKDSFLFFDYMFFNNGFLANFSTGALLFSYVFGLIHECKKNSGESLFYIYATGLFAIFFFIIHCRFFSNVKFNRGEKILFIREFFLPGAVGIRYSALWVSRLIYLTWITSLIYVEFI